MGKQRAPLEFNRLTGGIITEASPLTFPDNASIDEVNFELRNDGTRRRRLGFDFEVDHELIPTVGNYQWGEPSVVSSFLWENVSGRNEVAYTVIQVNEVLHFFRTVSDTLSIGFIIHTITVPGATRPCDFASIDGTLVIVSGGSDIITVSADLSNENAPTFTQENGRLTTRDLFGIPVWYNKSVETGAPTPEMIDLTDPFYYSKRPLVGGLPTLEGAEGQVNYQSTSYRTGVVSPYYQLSFVEGTDFFPSTYKGFSVSTFYATGGLGTTPNMSLEFGGGVPSFETIVYDCNTLNSAFVLKRRSSNRSVYDVDITEVQFAILFAATKSDFDLTDTTVGSVYNYNLRNQTFANSRLPKVGVVSEDPIRSFLNEAAKLPAMSDTVLSALYPNVEDDDNKTVDRFHAKDLVENPLGTAPAPKGYFIIDALERSTSRYIRWEELLNEQGHSTSELSVLPLDATPGGASAVAESVKSSGTASPPSSIVIILTSLRVGG